MQKRPGIKEVRIEDRFWTPYLKNIREIMMPYVFEKFEETGTVQNIREVAAKSDAKHIGHPFADGLLLESVRGASDFLAQEYDAELDRFLDELISIIVSAADEDGFLSTQTQQDFPDRRWGENGGDIIFQHDFYNHGALIEAAVSHYRATGKTTLLAAAVKAADLISSEMGYAPKKHIIPGHSLPEEAVVRLYTLLGEDEKLKEFAQNREAYLDLVRFWYDGRGAVKESENFTMEYHQNHLPFAEQTSAVGHAVRAALCYTGAAALDVVTGEGRYQTALDALWENVVNKKLHISGGIGTRHDIEGFDEDYNLPNDAYLETCAGISMAFWNGEMHLLKQDARYFDCFELSLYNNILGSIGSDFTHYFYQNPLINEGVLHRWEWHDCPCCPPMLLKIFSALGTYIYSYGEKNLCVNMFIGSSMETEEFAVSQKEKVLSVDSKGAELELKVRIPSYAENFEIRIEGEKAAFETEMGYAVLRGSFSGKERIEVIFDEPVRRVFANPAVEADRGRVAVMKGPYLMCAEGIDNGGNVDFLLSKEPQLGWKDGKVTGRAADGSPVTLVPYYGWGNRNAEGEETKMAVWLRQEDMTEIDTKGKLYGIYE